jgi:hypothetical protein
MCAKNDGPLFLPLLQLDALVIRLEMLLLDDVSEDDGDDVNKDLKLQVPMVNSGSPLLSRSKRWRDEEQIYLICTQQG